MNDKQTAAHTPTPWEVTGSPLVTGMTLRDYFAAAAMQGLLAGELKAGVTLGVIAEDAYHTADAMLLMRDK